MDHPLSLHERSQVLVQVLVDAVLPLPVAEIRHAAKPGSASGGAEPLTLEGIALTDQPRRRDGLDELGGNVLDERGHPADHELAGSPPLPGPDEE